MKYKAKCDGLQTYAIFQRGYTYQIFMYYDRLPKPYLDESIFPLHARVMALFDTVEENAINAQCIISTTKPTFSRQRNIMRKSTDSWCYKERNERHPTMHYTRVIEVK